MACPNCDHTMHGLGQTNAGYFFFWCPRCGTLRDSPYGFWDESRLAPKLVGRIREFVDELVNDSNDDEPKWVYFDQLNELGVLESIDFEGREDDQDDT